VAGHEAGATHEGGGHESGPVIENWFSFDYGPGKTHHHPPFGFALINFAVFLLLLNKLAGKSLREFVSNRHIEVRRSLDRARELEKKAQEQLKEYEKRTQDVDAEVQTLLGNIRKQAEAERQSIIARAESDAQKLLKDAESQVQVALDGAKRSLEQKAALLAVDLAEKLIRTHINDRDQRTLVDSYVASIEALATGSAAAGGHAKDSQP
jgi:F-type H+-transporting ATPase subunit b